jgi:vacuolar-type H+-ATPase subunit H
MSMNDITSSVEATEVEAEKILEEAKTRANEILLKSREEARKIVSSDFPMDEVKTECDGIIHKASMEAEEKIADSVRKASEISTNADKKVAEIVDLIVSIITGAKAA